MVVARSPTRSSSVSSPPEQACWLLADGMWVVIALAAAKLLLHCVYNDRYGYFRDEFDYLACGRHLAWGYVDQPPLVPFLTRLSGAVLGESLRAIRFLPALAISLAVVLTGMIARELGGRSYALLLSAVGVVVAPMYLSDGSLLTTNCLEPLLWTGCVYFAVLAIKRDDPRPWLWFGVIGGLGMEEKYSIAVLGFAIGVGLLLTDERRFLLSKWMWLGGLAALLIWLPNLLWNVKYDFPFLQLMHNIRASGRDVALSPAQYFSQQLLLLQPLAAPVWITGVMALLTWPRLKAFRSLGWSYLVAFAVFAGLKGKNYYLAPIYPMLFAAGAVAIEAGIERWRQGWLKPVYVVALLGAGAWLAPLVVPVLPIAQFVVYMNRLPIKVPRSEHSHMRAALPQHYADQFGWQEIVDEVNVAWQRIPVGERADCGIFAQDYGQAGAIDFLGRKYRLPAALSGHQSYFLWGPRGYSGNCLIVLDDRPEALEKKFDQVELVGVSTDNAYALERQIPVFICRGRKFSPLAEVWPGLKKWN